MKNGVEGNRKKGNRKNKLKESGKLVDRKRERESLKSEKRGGGKWKGLVEGKWEGRVAKKVVRSGGKVSWKWLEGKVVRGGGKWEVG